MNELHVFIAGGLVDKNCSDSEERVDGGSNHAGSYYKDCLQNCLPGSKSDVTRNMHNDCHMVLTVSVKIYSP